MDGRIVVPSSDEGFVPLARTRTGRLFKKHILNMGDLRHPVSGSRIRVDDAFVAKLTDNFKSGVCDIVQVPLADKDNKHTEDPMANIGEVVDIQASAGKVYAIFDARDEKAADKLGKTLLGASAMMHLDYTDSRTGKKVGPTLLHVCVTNRPYITGLEDYKEIVAASADGSGEAVLFTPFEQEERSGMDKDELIAALAEHGVDVAALSAKAEQYDAAAAKLAQIQQNPGEIKLTADVTGADVVGAIAELSNHNGALNSRVEVLEASAAAVEVDSLIKQGRIVPAQRDVMLELKMSQPETFDRLVPETPIVAMSAEAGLTPPEDQAQQKKLDEEIARLTNPEGDHGAVFSGKR